MKISTTKNNNKRVCRKRNYKTTNCFK